jgi:YVTN family beta-propeller protein
VNLDAHARRAVSALHDSAEGVDPFTRLQRLHQLERRRSRAQVAVAFALVVALVAAGVLASRNDQPAVGPLPSRVTIGVGRQPTTVAVGEGMVWVANQVGNSLTRIDPQTNQVTATVPVPDGVADVALGRDAVWTGGDRRGAAQVVRIDTRTNRVVATVRVGSQPTRLAVTDDAVWVTSLVGGTVTRIDPRTNRVVATIKTGGRPQQVTADDRSVWVAYPQDSLVKRIDPATNTVRASLKVAQPQGVALGIGSVWVANQRPGEVLRIDLWGARPAGRIRVAGKPAFVAVGTDAVWVGNTDGTVQRIDPRSDTVTATYPVDGALHGMAADGESLWRVDSINDTVTRTRLP